MTNTQKNFCRSLLEEFMTKMDQITKKGSIQSVRVSDKTDLRKKDQDFLIEVHFRPIA